MKEQFINEYIKGTPEFDKNLFDSREEYAKQHANDFQKYNAALEHGRALSGVQCPYCHSTNTKKISAISKAGNIALFGIFAMDKIVHQWHCNNCDSDF